MAQSMPFLVFVRMRYGDASLLFQDHQVRMFLALMLGAVALTALALSFHGVLPLGQAVRDAAFNVVSILTGTGFSTTDYEGWGTFAALILFLVMFIGGCAGSTTCGIKVFRFQVLFGHAAMQLRLMLQPSGVFKLTYNGKSLPEAVVASVTTFFVLFVTTTFILAVLLGLVEPRFDMTGAVVSAATSVANVGPALGGLAMGDGAYSSVGPMGSFAEINDAAKTLMALGMLLGRLELLTVIALFLPMLWRD